MLCWFAPPTIYTRSVLSTYQLIKFIGNYFFCENTWVDKTGIKDRFKIKEISNTWRMKIFVCFIACLVAVSSEFSYETPERSDFLKLLHKNYASGNKVIVAASFGISVSKVEVSRVALETLVANNADKKRILDELFSLFSAFDRDIAWHLTYQVVTHFSGSDQYVYYLFDRNNTELLVAGYKRCV